MEARTMTTVPRGRALSLAAGQIAAFAVATLLQKAANPLQYVAWTVFGSLVLTSLFMFGAGVLRRMWLELLFCGATIVAIWSAVVLTNIPQWIQTGLLVLVVIFGAAFLGTLLGRFIPAAIKATKTT